MKEWEKESAQDYCEQETLAWEKHKEKERRKQVNCPYTNEAPPCLECGRFSEYNLKWKEKKKRTITVILPPESQPYSVEKPALVKILFNAKGEPHQIIITLVEK